MKNNLKIKFIIALAVIVIVQVSGLATFFAPTKAHAQTPLKSTKVMGPTTVLTPALEGGTDKTSTTYTMGAADLTALATSDNNYYVTKGFWPKSTLTFDPTQYLAFDFSPANLPAGAVIDSVNLTHEYQVGTAGNFSATQYQIYDEGTIPIILGTLPGTVPTKINSDFSESLDLTSKIFAVSELNNLEVRFSGYTFEAHNLQTSHDLVKLTVSYHIIPTIPGLPTLVSPVNQSSTNQTEPTMTWQAPADGTGTIGHYELQIDSHVDFSAPIVDQNVAETSYPLTTPLVEGTYYWKVKTVNTDGSESDFTPVWQFTVDTTLPAAPNNIQVMDHPNDNGYNIDVSWMAPDPIGDVVGYKVAVNEINDINSANFTEMKDLSTTSVTIGVVKNNTPYYIFVVAVDAAGNMSTVDMPLVVSALDNLPPEVPTLTQVVLTAGTGQGVLTYTFSGDTTSVMAEAATDKTFTNIFQSITQMPPAGTVTFGNLVVGTTYYFQVTAYDEAGNNSTSDYLRGTLHLNSIVTVVPGPNGGTESIQIVSITPAPGAITTAGAVTTVPFVPIVEAAPEATQPSTAVTPTPTPTPTGAVKGGTTKSSSTNNNNTRNIILIILLVAAALAAYIGYRAVSRAETTKKKE